MTDEQEEHLDEDYMLRSQRELKVRGGHEKEGLYLIGGSQENAKLPTVFGVNV